jgi:hypothetical protein
MIARRPPMAAEVRGWVYSRYNLREADSKAGPVLWLLAKAVFRSIEAGHHQLISHWLRTHACLEPFLIALRRNISAIHPVSQAPGSAEGSGASGFRAPSAPCTE